MGGEVGGGVGCKKDNRSKQVIRSQTEMIDRDIYELQSTLFKWFPIKTRERRQHRHEDASLSRRKHRNLLEGSGEASAVGSAGAWEEGSAEAWAEEWAGA